MPPKYPYIENFCDDSVYVFSTIGQGPKGDKGDRGDAILPIFSEPIKWDISRDYPAHTIVLHGGENFISKVDVPRGIDISKTRYWQQITDNRSLIESIIGN